MCSSLVLSPGGDEQPWSRRCQQTSSPSLNTDARLPENHQICHLLLSFLSQTPPKDSQATYLQRFVLLPGVATTKQDTGSKDADLCLPSATCSDLPLTRLARLLSKNSLRWSPTKLLEREYSEAGLVFYLVSKLVVEVARVWGNQPRLPRRGLPSDWQSSALLKASLYLALIKL